MSKRAPAPEGTLLAEYHLDRVKELFELVLTPGRVRLNERRKWRPDPDKVDACIQLNAPDLTTLNTYLGQLDYFARRAIVGYLGLDGRDPKKFSEVGQLFGVTKQSVSAHFHRGIGALHNPKLTLKPE